MRRTRSLARVVAPFALVALIAARPAAAADGGAPVPARFSTAQIQEAEERWREGRTLYESGQIDEARLKYAQAFAVLDRTNILWNLAVSEFYAKRPLEALKHFLTFVDRPDADRKDVERARAKYIVEASAETGHVIIDAARGAEVLIDGELQPGAAPFDGPIHVLPGTHAVTARGGGRTYALEVTCGRGETTTAHFDMPRDAAVTVIVKERDARFDYPAARTITTVAVGAGAVVAFAVGIGFALDSKSKNDQNAAFIARTPDACVDRSSPSCADWQRHLDRQRSSAAIATGAYVAGGVLAAGALVSWFLWPKVRVGGAATEVALEPSLEVSLHGVHLDVGGRF